MVPDAQVKVAGEVLKQVYVAEKLSPPSLAQVQQTCPYHPFNPILAPR